MFIVYKKIIFSGVFNLCLFLMLMIGIQNSYQKTKVNLLIDKTANLPISFVIGISFISGSLTGNLIDFYFKRINFSIKK